MNGWGKKENLFWGFLFLMGMELDVLNMAQIFLVAAGSSMNAKVITPPNIQGNFLSQRLSGKI